MSDTHDRLESVEKAIDLFNREGVKAVLHAGDLVSPFVAPLFGRLQSDLYYVWGNNEGDGAGNGMLAMNVDSAQGPLYTVARSVADAAPRPR